MNYDKCFCAHCGQSIEYPSEGTGETVPCPTCGKSITLAPASSSRDASGTPPSAAGSTSEIISPTPEQLSTIRSFGKEPPPGLTTQEAAIWIEQRKIMCSNPPNAVPRECIVPEDQSERVRIEGFHWGTPEEHSGQSLNIPTNSGARAQEVTIQNADRPLTAVPSEIIPEAPKQWWGGHRRLFCPVCSGHIDVPVCDVGWKVQACPHCQIEIVPVFSGESGRQNSIPSRAVQDYPNVARAQDYYTKTNDQKLDALLTNCPSSDGCYWLPVSRAAYLVNIINEEKIGIGRAREIAERIHWAGYCVEPDARCGTGPYDWSQTLAIFKPCQNDPTEPSAAYLGAANLLRLCVLIAAADGQIDEAEIDVFRQFIESQLDLSLTDHQRLLALERLLTQDPSLAQKTLAKVAKSVPAHKRQLIGKVLVRVAAADHVIPKGELRALERIFKAFQLPPDALAKLVEQACPPSGSPGIQGRADSTPPQTFALDMARVYAITNETKEVVGILSVVMEDEEPEIQTPPNVIAITAPETLQASGCDSIAPGKKQFDGLDAALYPVLERLLARDTWPQSDFHALAREFHFMPLNIHDRINEWAEEKLGDFLLEGENPIVIRRDLITKERE